MALEVNNRRWSMRVLPTEVQAGRSPHQLGLLNLPLMLPMELLVLPRGPKYLILKKSGRTSDNLKLLPHELYRHPQIAG